MINRHLSKQGICRPVSRDHIAGSSVQLIEVTCFFLKLTADQVLVFGWIVGSCQVNLLKTGQARAGYCALIVVVQPCMMKIQCYTKPNVRVAAILA